MVRLKVKKAENYKTQFNKFQFQNGTIKREVHSSLKSCHSIFQFQNGTIKRTSQNGDTVTGTKFQFQNGTIKRSTPFTKMSSITRISIPKWYD